MGLRYLLDSTLLIDHFNHAQTATAFLLDHVEESAISVVTLAEVLSRPLGLENSLGLNLLGRLPVLHLEEADARLAAEFRHHHKLKLPDAFQAALATRYSLRLVTRNSRDFDPKKFPFVILYRI